jgi:hypothetical protein
MRWKTQRAAWDALDEGGDLWLAIVAAAISSAVGLVIAQTTDLRTVTAVVVAAVLGPLLLYAGSFLKQLRRPFDQHPDWRVENYSGQHADSMPVAIAYQGKSGAQAMHAKRFVCVVIDDADSARESADASSYAATRRAYPDDFPGAPAVHSGNYEVMWFEQRGRRRQPLVKYTQAVT